MKRKNLFMFGALFAGMTALSLFANDETAEVLPTPIVSEQVECSACDQVALSEVTTCDEIVLEETVATDEVVTSESAE